MAQLKTQKTNNSPDDFLNALAGPQQRADAHALCTLMQEATGEPPKMWGSSIIGFGDYHYTYKSGRQGDWMLVGFAPRKANLTVYIMDGFDNYSDLLDTLGTFTISKGCLYIKKLSDVKLPVLRELVRRSTARIKAGDITL